VLGVEGEKLAVLCNFSVYCQINQLYLSFYRVLKGQSNALDILLVQANCQ